MSSQPPAYAAVDPVTPSEPPKLGFGARLSNVFFAPSEAFADVNRAAQPVLPILALILFSMASVFVLNVRIKPDFHAISVEQTEKRLGKSISELEGQQRDQAETGIKISDFIQ